MDAQELTYGLSNNAAVDLSRITSVDTNLSVK